jgi:hypothetical protein
MYSTMYDKNSPAYKRADAHRFSVQQYNTCLAAAIKKAAPKDGLSMCPCYQFQPVRAWRTGALINSRGRQAWLSRKFNDCFWVRVAVHQTQKISLQQGS